MGSGSIHDAQICTILIELREEEWEKKWATKHHQFPKLKHKYKFKTESKFSSHCNDVALCIIGRFLSLFPLLCFIWSLFSFAFFCGKFVFINKYTNRLSTPDEFTPNWKILDTICISHLRNWFFLYWFITNLFVSFVLSFFVSFFSHSHCSLFWCFDAFSRLIIISFLICVLFFFYPFRKYISKRNFCLSVWYSDGWEFRSL